MRTILVLLVVSFLATSLLAQGPGGNRGGQQLSGRFYGKVVDPSNKGMEAASVTLVQERMDSATRQRKEVIVGGMLTLQNGDFSIENVPAFGRYKLRITGIGFKPFEQNVSFSLPNRNGNADPSAMMNALDKDLGNIKLELDDKVLSNVTVSASRPMVQMGIDRKIFNVDQNIVSAGGSAVDVMRNVPSVSVDIDGNISVRNSTPQIFVDGRPTTLTLEQIPADAIESVEVITNPSARFDASGGTAGILNIILKKNKRVGYSGNMRANIDSRGRVGFGGNVNVRQNKINTFVSLNVNQRKSIGTGETDRTTFRQDTTIRSLQQDRSVMNGMFGFGRAGFDYYISNRNTLTLSGSMARGRMNPHTTNDILVDYLVNSGLDSSEFQNRFSQSRNEFRNMGAQASFRHNFPKSGQEWTADVTYNKGRNNNNNTIQTDYFLMPGKTPDRRFTQQQRGNGVNSNLVLQTDYVNPLSDISKMEMGARVAIREVESENNFFRLTETGAYVPLEGRSIVYNSNDRVYAAYASFSSRIKNFGYQLGLRAESSNYQGVLLNKGESFNIDFPISLFPSLFLSQKISETSELQMNYSRRINRPNFWQLFPFYDFSDSLNISRGNPNLSPEFTNSVELSYSKTFKNRDNFLASLYFKNTNNLITRDLVWESIAGFKDSVPVLVFINANRSYNAGLEVTSRNKLTKWWETTSNANFFTSKIDLQNAEDPEQLFSYFIKLNNNFKMPKNLTFQLSAEYNSKRLVNAGGGGGGFGRGGFGFGGSTAAQGYIRPQFELDAALRFDFLKDRAASLSLSMNDILRTRKFDSHTESAFFIQDSYRRRDPQVLRLNFNWRFGKFDNNLFKRRNNRQEGEGGMEGIGF